MRIPKLLFVFLTFAFSFLFVPLSPIPIANASRPPACDWHWTPIPSPNPPAPGIARRIALRNDNDVWVAGTNLWHWNGTAWTIPVTGDDYGFRDIVTRGKNRVYALGTQLMFSNGKEWKQLGILSSWTPTALAVVSKKNVWVSVVTPDPSQRRGPYQTRFLHWDGLKWKKVKGIFRGQVQDMQVIGPNNIWAAGGDLLHWDGSAWTRVETGISDTEYTRIKVIDSKNIWAVGTITHTEPYYYQVGLITHWDGSAWTMLPTSDLSEDYSGLLPLAADNVWLTSDYRILHWDGTKWTYLYSDPPSNTGSKFGDIAQDDSNRLWVVGNFSGDNAWAMRQNGDTWDSFDLLDPTRAAQTSFNAITALSPNDVWVGGNYGNYPLNSDFVLFAHWNGTDWSFADMAHLPGAINVMSAVNAHDIWAVGGEDFFHYDGTSWSKIPGPSLNSGNSGGAYIDYSIIGLAAISHSDLWAIGTTRIHNALESVGATPAPQPNPLFSMTGPPLILHWDGTQWTEFDAPISNEYLNALNGIVALDSNDVWSVGTYGLSGVSRPAALHWDGITWSSIPIPNASLQGGFAGVTASAYGSMWAVGDSYDGVSYSALTAHWDGQQWQLFEDSSVSAITGAIPLSSNSLWGTGWQGKNSFIGLWNGGNWQKYWTSTQETYLAQLAMLSPNIYWAVGRQDSKSLVVRGACK